MKSSTTPDFWRTFAALPAEIRSRAKVAYRLWERKSRHPSLQFRKIGNLGSVRIGRGYRSLAVVENDTVYWFWIGNHDEYERLLLRENNPFLTEKPRP